MNHHFTPQEILIYAGAVIAVAVLCYGLIWGKFLDRVFGEVDLPNTDGKLTGLASKKSFLKWDWRSHELPQKDDSSTRRLLPMGIDIISTLYDK
jgi:hypothetical protein